MITDWPSAAGFHSPYKAKVNPVGSYPPESEGIGLGAEN